MQSRMLFVGLPAARATIAVACLALSLAACTNPSDPAVEGITEFSGPSAAVNVGLGFTVKSLVTIKRSTNFKGVVHFTAEGVPQGMLVGFAPSSLNGTAELAELSITALSAVAPGPHSFTIRASADNVASKSVQVSVMVTVPSYTVTISNLSPTVAQGSTQSIPITVARDGGFTGNITLGLIGLPAGVTATFSPQVIESGATNSTLTLSAPLTVPTALTNVTLRATTEILAEKLIPMQLTVGPATTPAVLISANPALLQIDGGQSMETELRLQRFGGFSGPVNVDFEGLPSNMTATVVPFAAGSNSTTLRVTVGVQETISTYQVRLAANGAGIQQASTIIAVQTRPMPDFLLLFDGFPPAVTRSVTISRGGTLNTGAELVRTSQYSLPVSLAATGAPAGVSLNMPTSIPASTSTNQNSSQPFNIVVNVSAATAPGVYNIVISGEAGAFTRNLTLVLTVN